MKTSLNQKFNSFDELNAVADKGAMSHKYLRIMLWMKKAENNKKGAAKWAVHINGDQASYLMFAPIKNVLSNTWSYAPLCSTGYKSSQLLLNLPSVKKHLPENWTGENGTFHLGEPLICNIK